MSRDRLAGLVAREEGVMKLRHREWSVAHGHALGFHLAVRDVTWSYTIVDKATSVFLAALGNPCCGKGLGRIPGTDGLWFRILNLPGRLSRHDRRVADIPLTVGQARLLVENLDSWEWVVVDGWDEDGELFFTDGRLTKVRCEWCDEVLPAEGRASGAVLNEHDCSDRPVEVAP